MAYNMTKPTMMKLIQPYGFGCSKIFLQSFIGLSKSKFVKVLSCQILRAKTHFLLIFAIFQAANLIVGLDILKLFGLRSFSVNFFCFFL